MLLLGAVCQWALLRYDIATWRERDRGRWGSKRVRRGLTQGKRCFLGAILGCVVLWCSSASVCYWICANASRRSLGTPSAAAASSGKWDMETHHGTGDWGGPMQLIKGIW
ncbi:hypothetical protein BASA81_017725 [Batrachochytrium salamandrivorans]|nr:hypothetical protein BASA81_017725 [Batrachochytrium salamandrivorans]